MSKTDFERDFIALCELLDMEILNVEDEHERHPVYTAAVRSQHWERVLSLLPRDPEPLLSGTILVELLDQVEPDSFDVVVAAAPVSQHDFVRRRREDIELLRIVREGRATAETIEAVIGGTDWLQRRAAETIPPGVVLDQLAKNGRTRRVRSLAGQRIERST